MATKRSRLWPLYLAALAMVTGAACSDRRDSDADHLQSPCTSEPCAGENGGAAGAGTGGIPAVGAGAGGLSEGGTYGGVGGENGGSNAGGTDGGGSGGEIGPGGSGGSAGTGGTGGAAGDGGSGGSGGTAGSGGSSGAGGTGGTAGNGGTGGTGGSGGTGGAGGAAGDGGDGGSADPCPGGTVDGTQAQELVGQGALLLDVRTTGEFAGGALPGAVNIPVGELSSRLDELPTDTTIITYCASGSRSATAAALLRNEGFTVCNLGAMSNWGD